MINYIDQLILKSVLHDDLSAYKELDRCIPTKYHLAHFQNQKELYTPLLYKIIKENLNFEDINSAKKFLKTISARNLEKLRIFQKYQKILEELNAKPILTSDIASYFRGYCKTNERAFENICFFIDESKTVQIFDHFLQNGWEIDDSKYTEIIKLKHHSSFELNLRKSFLGHNLDYFLKHVDILNLESTKIKTLNNSLTLITYCLSKNNNSWIYDAIKLIPNVDWNVVIRSALELDKTYYLLKRLEYLKETHNAAVPDFVFKDLSNSKLSFAQKLEKIALNKNRLGFKEQLLFLIADFLRRKNTSIFELFAYLDANAD